MIFTTNVTVVKAVTGPKLPLTVSSTAVMGSGCGCHEYTASKSAGVWNVSVNTSPPISGS